MVCFRDNDDEATPMKQPGKRGKRGKTGRKAKTENGQSRRTHNTAPNDEDEMSDDEELDKGLRYDWVCSGLSLSLIELMEAGV